MLDLIIHRGFTFAFGSFQSYYEVTYLPTTSPSAISWIGSLQSALLICSGVVTGQLFDRGYFKSLMFIGAFLSTFAVMMVSLSTEFYQILLSQGIAVGLGCGALFTPTMALIARTFRKKRAIAMGVVVCGAPTGMWLPAFSSPLTSVVHRAEMFQVASSTHSSLNSSSTRSDSNGQFG